MGELCEDSNDLVNWLTENELWHRDTDMLNHIEFKFRLLVS